MDERCFVAVLVYPNEGVVDRLLRAVRPYQRTCDDNFSEGERVCFSADADARTIQAAIEPILEGTGMVLFESPCIGCRISYAKRQPLLHAAASDPLPPEVAASQAWAGAWQRIGDTFARLLGRSSITPRAGR